MQGQTAANGSRRNTYDNAALYTDHMLAQTIDLLSRTASHDTALLYVSDHGESLGEFDVDTNAYDPQLNLLKTCREM